MPSRSLTRPRGQRALAILVAGVLALAGAGCGGAEVPAEEVPGPPRDLPLPGGADDAAPLSEGGTTPTPTPTPTATPTATATPGASGAATPTPEPQDSASTGTEAEGTGADAEAGASGDDPDFERYCAANPGAC